MIRDSKSFRKPSRRPVLSGYRPVTHQDSAYPYRKTPVRTKTLKREEHRLRMHCTKRRCLKPRSSTGYSAIICCTSSSLHISESLSEVKPSSQPASWAMHILRLMKNVLENRVAQISQTPARSISSLIAQWNRFIFSNLSDRKDFVREPERCT